MAERDFPVKEGDIGLLLNGLAERLPAVAASLGVTPDEVQRIVDDAAVFTYLQNTSLQIANTKEAFSSAKRRIIRGKASGPVAVLPAFPVLAFPATASNGIIANARRLIRKIKASPGYNTIVGESLGLVRNEVARLDAEEIFPEMQITALPGSVIEFRYIKRRIPALRIDMKRGDAKDWEVAVVATRSPVSHVLAPLENARPELRQYRAVYLKNNATFGKYSPVHQVVTTP